MKTRHLLVLAAAAVLSGCATYPGGLSKAEWDALPPEKQAEYRRLEKSEDYEKNRAARENQQYAQNAIREAETFRMKTAQDYASPR